MRYLIALLAVLLFSSCPFDDDSTGPSVCEGLVNLGFFPLDQATRSTDWHPYYMHEKVIFINDEGDELVFETDARDTIGRGEIFVNIECLENPGFNQLGQYGFGFLTASIEEPQDTADDGSIIIDGLDRTTFIFRIQPILHLENPTEERVVDRLIIWERTGSQFIPVGETEFTDFRSVLQIPVNARNYPAEDLNPPTMSAEEVINGRTYTNVFANEGGGESAYQILYNYEFGLLEIDGLKDDTWYFDHFE